MKSTVHSTTRLGCYDFNHRRSWRRPLSTKQRYLSLNASLAPHGIDSASMNTDESNITATLVGLRCAMRSAVSGKVTELMNGWEFNKNLSKNTILWRSLFNDCWPSRPDRVQTMTSLAWQLALWPELYHRECCWNETPGRMCLTAQTCSDEGTPQNVNQCLGLFMFIIQCTPEVSILPRPLDGEYGYL